MFRLWIGVCAPFFSSSEGTGKHFVLLKRLLFSHGWMPAQGRCSKTLWGVRKAKKCHLCQRDSKVWSAQGLGPASPWNTSWQGAARGFHTGCAPLWMMVPTCLSLSTSDPDGPFFPEGFSPLHNWFRETFFFSALIAAFKHWPQASHWAFLWVRDCNVFPFYEAPSVISLRRCSTEWITGTNKKMAYFCI